MSTTEDQARQHLNNAILALENLRKVLDSENMSWRAKYSFGDLVSGVRAAQNELETVEEQMDIFETDYDDDDDDTSD